MTTGVWFYCDPERDDETAHGPVSLAQLAELIRTGALPYDVLLSPVPEPGPTWVEADTVQQVLEAIPLDRERLIREYVDYGETAAGDEKWGWASDRMFNILEGVPELAWSLTIEMIERAPSDKSIGFIAASPLEDLLSKHGPEFIDRVENHAAESAKFCRALSMLRRLGMTEEVWHRVQKTAAAHLMSKA